MSNEAEIGNEQEKIPGILMHHKIMFKLNKSLKIPLGKYWGVPSSIGGNNKEVLEQVTIL